MLWLRRKRSDSLVLQDGLIEIVVGRIDGDTVQIGVQAPDEIEITRGEVWLSLERQCGSVVDQRKKEK